MWGGFDLRSESPFFSDIKLVLALRIVAISVCVQKWEIYRLADLRKRLMMIASRLLNDLTKIIPKADLAESKFG